MRVAYVRVSTIEQNEERQIEGLAKFNIDKWFTEKISGKNTDRPQLQAMLDFVREGDVVYVHDFSRLARSTKDLLEIVDLFNNKGVSLVSNKENIDSGTPQGKLMLTMIGAIAEFERTNLLERQREGIAIAKKHDAECKAKGNSKDVIYKGRKTIIVEDSILNPLYDRYISRQITKSELAKALKVSRPTLDKILKSKAL